jgi:hypothetical protein
MDDAALVVAVAAEMVRRHGEDAPSHLREQAAIAARIADRISVKASTDIAEAAAMLSSKIAIFWSLSIVAGMVFARDTRVARPR